MSATCGHCSAPRKPGHRFCTGCGRPSEPPGETPAQDNRPQEDPVKVMREAVAGVLLPVLFIGFGCVLAENTLPYACLSLFFGYRFFLAVVVVNGVAAATGAGLLLGSVLLLSTEDPAGWLYFLPQLGAITLLLAIPLLAARLTRRHRRAGIVLVNAVTGGMLVNSAVTAAFFSQGTLPDPAQILSLTLVGQGLAAAAALRFSAAVPGRTATILATALSGAVVGVLEVSFRSSDPLWWVSLPQALGLTVGLTAVGAAVQDRWTAGGAPVLLEEPRPGSQGHGRPSKWPRPGYRGLARPAELQGHPGPPEGQACTSGPAQEHAAPASLEQEWESLETSPAGGSARKGDVTGP